MYSRTKARVLLLQAIYQWHQTHDAAQEIQARMLVSAEKTVDNKYFSDIFYGVVENCAQLDAVLQTCLTNRLISGVTEVELSALRLAAYELMYRMDVPYRVIINESIDLVKGYGAQDGYKLVNAVLDKLVEKIQRK